MPCRGCCYLLAISDAALQHVAIPQPGCRRHSPKMQASMDLSSLKRSSHLSIRISTNHYCISPPSSRRHQNIDMSCEIWGRCNYVHHQRLVDIFSHEPEQVGLLPLQVQSPVLQQVPYNSGARRTELWRARPSERESEIIYPMKEMDTDLTAHIVTPCRPETPHR